jgi:hypothetical protein
MHAMNKKKHAMQANGRGTPKGANPIADRRGAGESGGGPYPNPHTGKAPKHGFLDHGGQTEIFQKTNPGEPD